MLWQIFITAFLFFFVASNYYSSSRLLDINEDETFGFHLLNAIFGLALDIFFAVCVTGLAFLILGI